MGFMSQEITLDFQYTRDDCLSATKEALEHIHFKVRNENLLAGTIQADVKAGITSTTWGDIMTITVSDSGTGGCKVIVNSTAKAASVLAGRQQAKNIQIFTDALSNALASYEKVELQSTQSSTGSVADEIKKFKELLDLGAISQEEYDAKKRQLLGL